MQFPVSYKRYYSFIFAFSSSLSSKYPFFATVNIKNSWLITHSITNLSFFYQILYFPSNKSNLLSFTQFLFPISRLNYKMNTIETEFGFDEYIMPTTYSTMPKLESYDAQLYPSGTKNLEKCNLLTK